MSGEDIKPGYKRTEVGVIPEEWRVETIGSIFQLKQGVQTPVELQSAIEKEGYKRFIRIVDVTDPSITWRYIKDPGIDHHISPNDLFMVRYGSPGLLGIGFSGIIANNLFRLIPKKAISVHFYYQYIKNKKAEIVDISGSSTMPAINFGTLSALAILYPPLAEQRAIATALSDVDALLAKLDQLIAKKRDLKQATMQQLLTGQTRLPGFSGEWEVKRLGDFSRFLRNGAFSRAELEERGSTHYLHYGDIHASISARLDAVAASMPYLSESKAKTLDRLECGDLVFADASEDYDGVGKSVEISNTGSGLVSGLHTIAIRFQKSILADGFKAYLQFIPSFRNHLLRLASGTKVYATQRSNIASAELKLPPAQEQTAIATVLSDMDAELAALEARRDKTRALKQGMMQELLTGRIRLV